MTRQKLGQNFLHDKNTAARIVQTVSSFGGTIVEIGPGKGIMTDILAVLPLQQRIIAVEKDPGLYNELIRKNIPGIEFHNKDILKMDLRELNAGNDLIILGNIPYYISKEIVDWIIRWNDFISKGTLMVQKEFFQKITSKERTKAYNAQSVMFNTLFETEKLFDVPPGAFNPPPKVTSTVFIFKKPILRSLGEAERRQVPGHDDLMDFYMFLKNAFSHRRKTLINNLGQEYDKNSISQFFTSGNLPLSIRAEDMTPENLKKLYVTLNQVPLPDTDTVIHKRGLNENS